MPEVSARQPTLVAMNDAYRELYESFHWLVPTQFNIANACLYRWAQNPLQGRRIALYHEDESGSASVWTYSRLSECTQRLSSGLVKMGVQRGDRVAIAMAQRPEAVAALMAILSLGAVAMPLSPKTAPQVWARQLEAAEAQVAITDSVLGPDILQAQQHYRRLVQIISLDFEHGLTLSWRSLLARQTEGFRPVNISPWAPALMLWESSETDETRGAQLSHASLIGALPGFVAGQDWFPQAGDLAWSTADWSSTAGLYSALLPALYFGRPVLSIAAADRAGHMLDAIARYGVTNLWTTVAQLHRLLEEVGPRDVERFRQLRAVAVDSAMPSALPPACQQRLGVVPNVNIHLAGCPAIMGDSHEKWPPAAGSMGRPYPGHRIAVLGPDGQPCPAGIEGDVAVHQYDRHGHPDPALPSWLNDDAPRQDSWQITGLRAQTDDHGQFWPTLA